jgi:hypothetical protein
MNDLNEVHRSLGQIETNVTVLVQSVKELREYQLRMNGSVGKAHDRLDNLEPHVEDYKVTKQRAVMGLIGIGGLTGIIGGKMAELLGGFIR